VFHGLYPYFHGVHRVFHGLCRFFHGFNRLFGGFDRFVCGFLPMFSMGLINFWLFSSIFWWFRVHLRLVYGLSVVAFRCGVFLKFV
jgi:hypothetical protein